MNGYRIIYVPTRYSYVTFDISTIKGAKQAKKFKANGWKIVSNGFQFVTLRKVEVNAELQVN